MIFSALFTYLLHYVMITVTGALQVDEGIKGKEQET